MESLVGQQDIVMYLLPQDKGILMLANQVREEELETVCHEFRQNPIRVVAQTDRSELVDKGQVGNLRDEDNIRVI